MADFIALRGVRVHNLQGIDVDIPLGGLTVVTGVSGAGKSSLAFDTLYAEAQRRYLQSFSAYTRQFLERFDQPEADRIGDVPPAIAVSQRGLGDSPRATVGTVTEIFDYLRLLLARAGIVVCPACGQEVKAQQPADVLAALAGFPAGTRLSIAFASRPDADQDPANWLAGLREEGFVRLQVDGKEVRLDQGTPPASVQEAWVVVDRLEVGRTASERLTDSLETAFRRGQGRLALLEGERTHRFDRRLICPRCEILYPQPDPDLFHFNDPRGACPLCQGTGVHQKTTCPECLGTRLGAQTDYVRLAGKTLRELCALSLSQLMAYSDEVPRDAVFASRLIDTIRTRLRFLLAVELGYLTLQRSAPSLSSGEARRVRLTTALGSNLAGALYVFDEPTAGLHVRDRSKVLAQLERLRDAGNTLVVVENDLEVLESADRVVDLGPGAGEEGGRLLYQGKPAGLGKSEESVTAAYVSGRRGVGVPARRRPSDRGVLRLTGADLHNLQNLTVDFPLNVLCVVTGVSGAGKSSLVRHTLYPLLAGRKQPKLAAVSHAEVLGAGQINDVLLMDQQPLGHTGRSNPATHLKVFDEIRKVFADTTDARIRNFSPGHFSFNQPGGRCDTCEGQGVLTVDMQFLADVTMTCPDCQGTRFKKEILAIKVRNLSIAEVLNLTAREAFRFFRAQPAIERRLKHLLDVGLDYLRLGQPADTLSGGESQRLKLAGQLASSRKPRCLFLLEEPTIGLHPADIVRLLDCFDRLLATGHSLIVVEHDLDVIQCADHVIDLGPGAGPDGGRVVATGTPEQVAQVAESATGQALRPRLT